MSAVELVVGFAASAVIAVFFITLRVMKLRARVHDDVPAATVVDGGERWLEGRGRARFIGRADAFHRFAVAAAFTGIAVMITCVVGVVVLGIAYVAVR